MVLIFTAPLVCWALIARTARTGEEIAGVLGCCVLVEVAAARGWLFGSIRVTLITALSALSIAILIWGAVREGKHGASPLLCSRRGLAGLTLSALYCLVCGLACAYVVVSGGDDMPARAPAPVSSVLPLAPGLAVVSDTATCKGQAGNSCMRDITLRDTAYRTPQQFEDAVLSGLEHRHGWRFDTYDTSCRADGGWALDRQTVCAWVESWPPYVDVYLETHNG